MDAAEVLRGVIPGWHGADSAWLYNYTHMMETRICLRIDAELIRVVIVLIL
jgi:hypothetical protein